MFNRRVAAAMLFVTLSASAAQAGGGAHLDVTGTWQGSMTCSYLSLAGDAQKFVFPITVGMLHENGLVAAEMTTPGVATAPFPRGASPAFPLCGFSAGNPAKPGQGLLNFSAAAALVFVSKGGIPTFPGEFGLSAKLSEPNAKGLSGKVTGSVILDSFVSGLLGGGTPTLGSCKMKIERTSNDLPTMEPGLLELCGSILTIVTP